MLQSWGLKGLDMTGRLNNNYAFAMIWEDTTPKILSPLCYLNFHHSPLQVVGSSKELEASRLPSSKSCWDTLAGQSPRLSEPRSSQRLSRNLIIGQSPKCHETETRLDETPSLQSMLVVSKCGCLITQSCPTLGDPMDCSPQGTSVHGLPRQEYWGGVAIAFARGSSRPRG